MRKVLAALAMASMLAACNVFTESPPGSETSTGVYVLQSVNSKPLPYTLSESGGSKTELIDDTISLFQGGTFARTYHTRTTANGQVTNATVARTGTWAIGIGATITLSANEDGARMIVAINARRMTSMDAGISYLYMK